MPALPRSSRPRRRGRRVLGAATVLAAALAAVLGTGALSPSPAVAAGRTTVVSMTFDDANADQLGAASTLQSNGLRGTFFINSGFLGANGYMTTAQVQGLAQAGHEIGGHTVNHPDLTAISSAEAKRQICLDRQNLSALGVAVSDFAYPFASENSAVQTLVGQCGYNSARSLGDLQTRFGCAGCGFAESIPPSNPLATRTIDEVDSTWTLKDLQDPVLNAEKVGGWVQFTFHHVCANKCDSLAIDPALFSQFSSWLANRVRTTAGTTSVKTVAQVINKPVQPVVSAGYPAPAAAGTNAIKNPGLETVDATTGVPTCFVKGGYGANTPTFSVVGTAHAGTKAEQIAMAGYSDGDAKLLPALDQGDCSPTVVPGHTYSLRTWYTSTVVTQYAVYLRDAAGTWRYWTSSPWFAATSNWVNATWTTDAVPDGTTGLTFGLNIFSNGTLVTDDVAMYDSVGAPTGATAAPAAAARLATGAVSPKAPRLRHPERPGAVQVVEPSGPAGRRG